jgi:hypothetical protein
MYLYSNYLQTSNNSNSPSSSLSIDSKNKRNLESDKSEPLSKHQANGLLDLGSDPEDDPFFDDPPPKPAKQYNARSVMCRQNLRA